MKFSGPLVDIKGTGWPKFLAQLKLAADSSKCPQALATVSRGVHPRYACVNFMRVADLFFAELDGKTNRQQCRPRAQRQLIVALLS